jgi:branched-chain amino acid aminotransferase
VSEKVFLNDNLIDIDKARVSVADSGFLYGAGLFETMRSHNGIVFSLKDHLDRLFFSARALSIQT